MAKQALDGIISVFKKEKTVFDLEYPCHSPQEERWFMLRVMNFESDTPKVVLAHQDITERKKAEETISESEKNYRTLFEKILDGVYKSSSEGKFIEVNPACVAMLGYDSKEDLLAIDIKSALYFETEERENAVEQDNLDGMAVYRLRKKDGSEIWVEDRGNVARSSYQISYIAMYIF